MLQDDDDPPARRYVERLECGGPPACAVQALVIGERTDGRVVVNEPQKWRVAGAALDAQQTFGECAWPPLAHANRFRRRA